MPPDVPADMLGARLAGWLGGLLEPRLGGALSVGDVGTGEIELGL